MSESFQKWDQHKARADLLPPKAILAIARVLSIGASRYGDQNWRKNTEPGRYVAAALRHLLAFMGGEVLDPDTGEHHLAHAATNCLFLVELTSQTPEKPQT